MWEIKQWLSAGIKHSEGSVMVLGCPSARVVGDLIENELEKSWKNVIHICSVFTALSSTIIYL